MADHHSTDAVNSTEVSRVIKVPRKTVYQAFLDPKAVESWLPPDTMTGQMHAFEPREGGTIRMSLIYQNQQDAPGGSGKSADDTDTFDGKVAELVPDRKIVWLTRFESDDAAFAGEMKIIWSLEDHPDGTKVTSRCENIPSGINLSDNEEGSRQSLQKLAELLE